MAVQFYALPGEFGYKKRTVHNCIVLDLLNCISFIL